MVEHSGHLPSNFILWRWILNAQVLVKYKTMSSNSCPNAWTNATTSGQAVESRMKWTCAPVLDPSILKQYLKTNKMFTDEKLVLFSMRCRMNELKCNYRMKNSNNLNCALCRQNFAESESHLLQCSELISEPELVNEIPKIIYSDIFGNLKDQIKALKIWKTNL